MPHLARGVRRRRGSQAITVAPQSTITITPSSFTLAVGSSQIVTVAVRDASGNTVHGVNVSFSSSDTNVATVTAASGNGPYTATVYAIANGSATVTASTNVGSAAATVTSSTPPTNWFDPLIGTDKVILADPGTVGSSTQRVEWAAVVGPAMDVQWNFAVNLPGPYPMLSGTAPSNSGYMQYYDGAINHWAYARMNAEGSSGTHKVRGDTIAQQYITYALASPIGALQHVFPETVLGYYLMYGDANALTVLGRYKAWWNGNNANCWPDAIRAFNNSQIREGREMARLILAALSLHKAGVTTPQTVAAGAYLRTYASPLAVAQDYAAVAMEKQLANGSWNMGSAMRNSQYNFHAALMCDAMYKVHAYSANAAIVTSITAAASFLKNSMFNTGWPYTGVNPFWGPGMADYAVDNTGNPFSVPFSATPVGSGGVGMNVDLGNLFATMFYRTGDAAFARQLLGTTSPNAYGTSNARYGHLAPGKTLFGTASLTQMKQLNELMWQAWEYMP